ncbi:MAG: hypothetical protein P4L83_05095 [Nevskia sp.]|nr:hypothetical protein [Nevskia sp.]
MNPNPDRLYELIPVVYRLRDADQGYPLRALLRVVQEQVEVVEKDIAGLYENWFIETCQDWVVPYIGALIGYTPVSSGPQTATGARAQARERILVPRREVANTIRFRRRKGTLAVLEDLAEAVAGWPAHAVEFYRLLAVTQNIDHLHMDRGRTAELRDGDALDALGGPFDEMARNVDVRRVNSLHSRGTSNIPEVGVFVWRLRSYTVTQAPAYCYEEESPNCFLFSALGNDSPLYVNPQAAGADPALPLPIARRDLEVHEAAEGAPVTSGVPYYYGPGKSLVILTGTPATAVPAERIVPADLSGWKYRPLPGQVAVDPVLGRIMFPPSQTRRQAVWVSYSYGFSADIGGGEYPRSLSQAPDSTLYRVGQGLDPKSGFTRIADALTQWKQDAPANAVIEIVDSAVYAEPIAVELARGQTLQLRGAEGSRPVIRLLDWQTSAADNLSVSGVTGSWFVLDGVVVSGRGMQVGGTISGVTIRHCTLVPGWSLDSNCECNHPTEPSIEVVDAPRCITIEHSIVGAIQVERDQAAEDPLRLQVSDSVIDATRTSQVALGASGKLCAHVTLELRRSTVFGQVQTHLIELAENSILLGDVRVCRRQQGCMRFCYVTPASRTPRRYECQPDLVRSAVDTLYPPGDVADTDARNALLQAETLRVVPQFDSTRYGTPGYCRLALDCAVEISAGADDSSEMGVFHDLYQPQRSANLRERLNEYTPAGSDAGVLYAS